MTYEDAVKLCSVASYADDGCSHCVTNLMNSIESTWPDVDWVGAFDEARVADDGGGNWHRADSQSTSTQEQT